MREYIHIVCLDAPSPPDYGGAIDMYYKIISLHSIGKKIILHYFDYKKDRHTAGLEPYCEEINSYSRSSFLKSILTFRPYIVSSRSNSKLIQRLNEDDHPVLLEGIHCTGIISGLSPGRKIAVRVHNNEARYYQTLVSSETNFFRKLYYFFDSALLHQYQKRLPGFPEYAFISSNDENFFKENYRLQNLSFVPCFLPWQEVSSKAGKGAYCLYHGNLSIPENKKAALWLVQNILPEINLPLIIAGKAASSLKSVTFHNKNVRLVTDPSDQELRTFIQDAHINLLPSVNSTGVKLKLLHALLEGRFCIGNYNAIIGSAIENHVTVAETAEDWVSTIKKMQSMEFTNDMIEERKKIRSIYNNFLNAQKLSALL